MLPHHLNKYMLDDVIPLVDMSTISELESLLM